MHRTVSGHRINGPILILFTTSGYVQLPERPWLFFCKSVFSWKRVINISFAIFNPGHAYFYDFMGWVWLSG